MTAVAELLRRARPRQYRRDLSDHDDGSTPGDNPFSSQPDLAKYFAYDIRNSFGMAFDPITGQLWDMANGPDAYDEINVIRPGFNSGWERIMGPVNRDSQGISDLVQFPGSQYADPIFSWYDPVGPTAIVFFNSGQWGAEYQDDVFVGDINNGHLYHFKPMPREMGSCLPTRGWRIWWRTMQAN